jgi:hypothetical protein
VLLTTVTENPGWKNQELIKHLRRPKQEVNKRLHFLKGQGLLYFQQRGRDKHWYRSEPALLLARAGECAVCLDTERNRSVLVPCGHAFCQQCAPQLVKCPLCPIPITSVMRIYL